MARRPAWLLALLSGALATGAFAQAAAVSENPVRGDQVVISWPTGTGSARVFIFTFTGEQLFATTVAPASNEYVWDLMIGSRRVVNGAYIVVVDVDGHHYRRRLFVARPGGAP